MQNVNISKDWIYYISTNTDFDEETKKTEGLYKVRTNGKNNTAIHQNVKISDLHIAGNWIYYIAQEDKHNEDNGKLETISSLYKIKTDGTKKQVINNLTGTVSFEGSNSVFRMIVDKDWIFYELDETDSIYKIKTNGTKNQVFVKQSDAIVGKIENCVYYCRDGKSYVIKTNGTGKKQIANFELNFEEMHYLLGWVYYSDTDNNVYKMRPDGTKKKAIK